MTHVIPLWTTNPNLHSPPSLHLYADLILINQYLSQKCISHMQKLTLF